MFQLFSGNGQNKAQCAALLIASLVLLNVEALAFNPDWRIKRLGKSQVTGASAHSGSRILTQTRAFAQDSSPEVQIVAVLRRAPVTSNGWLLETTERERYLILNPEGFMQNRLFQSGTLLSVTGRLRPDVSLPESEGKALIISKMVPAPLSEPFSITGILNPTVESGGWTVTSPESGQKYVLLGTQAVEDETWFQKGQMVKIKGTVRKDIPTIFQEGPVLVVHRIQAAQNTASKSGAIALYYPNRSMPTGILLNHSISRRLHGAATPEAAIQTLLKGPSAAEQKQGYFLEAELQSCRLSSVSTSPTGEAVVILDAPAILTFTDPQVLPRFYEQIRLTMKSFDTIQTVNLVIRDEQQREKWRFP